MKINTRRLAVAVTLLALAGGSWWLARLTNEPEAAFDGKSRHDPDFIVENFQSVVMTPAGQPQYRLGGDRMVHYGDDGSNAVDHPNFIQYTPGRAPLHARAREGFVPSDTTYIRLTGDVHLAQGHDPQGSGHGSAGGDIRTQQMTIQLDRSR